ncbi:hypothetical protein B0H13DRAFT_1892434 [Mycena leptocephala]|nr:hypothetical protein B0H13DRAFT_1892434 [Mycena leptocephala]
MTGLAETHVWIRIVWSAVTLDIPKMRETAPLSAICDVERGIQEKAGGGGRVHDARECLANEFRHKCGVFEFKPQGGFAAGWASKGGVVPWEKMKKEKSLSTQRRRGTGINSTVKLTGEKTDTNCVDVAGRLLGLRSGVLTSVNARAVSKDRRLYTRGSDNEFRYAHWRGDVQLGYRLISENAACEERRRGGMTRSWHLLRADEPCEQKNDDGSRGRRLNECGEKTRETSYSPKIVRQFLARRIPKRCGRNLNPTKRSVASRNEVH